MHGQERILREQFTQAACGECGALHQPDDMLVLAQRGSRWLVLLTCWQCKHRGIFVASFGRPSPSRESFDSSEHPDPLAAPHAASTLPQHWSLPPTASLSDGGAESATLGAHPLQPLSDAPVTAGDVENIKRFLNGFDGDFRTLFGSSGR